MTSFSHLPSTVPIASLSPSLPELPARSIKAVVTLLWPYSSLTRKCALLLAEEDFRLRRRKGQVRVRFEGAAAENIADQRLQIGDVVHLALAGCDWVNDEQTERTETPGRSVEYELRYRNKLRLEAYRGEEQVANLDVNRDASPGPTNSHFVGTFDGTSSPLGRLTDLGPEDGGVPEGRRSERSAAELLKHNRLSSGIFFDPDYGGVDESSLEQETKRRRISWRRDSRKWRFVRDSRSPTDSGDFQESDMTPIPYSKTIGRENEKLFPKGAKFGDITERIDKSSYNLHNLIPSQRRDAAVTTTEGELSIQERSTREESRSSLTEAGATMRTENDTRMYETSQSIPLDPESPHGEPRTIQWGEAGSTEQHPTPSQDQTNLAVVPGMDPGGVLSGGAEVEYLTTVFPPRPIQWGEAGGESISSTLRADSDLEILGDTGIHLDQDSLGHPSLSHSIDSKQSEYGYARKFLASGHGEELPDVSRSSPIENPALKQQSDEHDARSARRTFDERIVSHKNQESGTDRESYSGDFSSTSDLSEHTIDYQDKDWSSEGNEEDPQDALEIPEQKRDTVVIDLLSDTEDEIEADEVWPNKSASTAEELNPAFTAMQPPALPRIQTQGLTSLPVLSQFSVPSREDPVTPVLHPLSSAILPLPSPFPSDIEASHISHLDQQRTAEPETSQSMNMAISDQEESHDGAPFVTEDFAADGSLMQHEHADSEISLDQRQSYHHPHSAERPTLTAAETHLRDSAHLVRQSVPTPAIASHSDEGNAVQYDFHLPEMERMREHDVILEDPQHRTLSGQVRQSEESPTNSGRGNQGNPTDSSPSNPKAVGVPEPSTTFPGVSQSTTDIVSRPSSATARYDDSENLTHNDAMLEPPRDRSHLRKKRGSLESNILEAKSSRKTRASGHVADHLPTDWGQNPEKTARLLKTRKKTDSNQKGDALSPIQPEEDLPSSENSTALRQMLSPPSSEEASSHQPLAHRESRQGVHLLTPESSQQENTISMIPNQGEHYSNLPSTPRRGQHGFSLVDAMPRNKAEVINNTSKQPQRGTDAPPSPNQQKEAVDSQGSLHDENLGDQGLSNKNAPENTMISGFRTSLSYYHPLSSISFHFNTVSQRHDPYSSVDILALVIIASGVPKRASTGRRDYNTTVLITDRSIFPQNISVQIFRPWKSALPEASAGDVILLRSMGIKGYKLAAKQGRVGLASGKDSAWCVWRFLGDSTASMDKNNVIKIGDEAVSEEMKGPPVEIGDEERNEVRKLRSWWTDEVHKYRAGDQTADPIQH